MALAHIITGRTPGPRRTLLYGAHGVGKSTFGAMMPAPIFISLEDGLNDIDCHRFPLASSYDDVVQSLVALRDEPHEYRTVVIDSADWLERLIHSAVCRAHNVRHIGDIQYGRGYGHATAMLHDILRILDDLRLRRGLGVLLIAHADISPYHDPAGETYDQYAPCLHRQASALLLEWCDDVLFGAYRVQTRTVDEGFGRRRTVGYSTGERIIYTTERRAHLAKNRLSLPDELPLDARIYAAYAAGDVAGAEALVREYWPTFGAAAKSEETQNG